MKYRVLKIEDEYFPQYKSWWTFGWRNFTEDWTGGGRTSISFFTEDFAIEYCKKKIKVKEPEKVVWESNPEYDIGFGPE